MSKKIEFYNCPPDPEVHQADGGHEHPGRGQRGDRGETQRA